METKEKYPRVSIVMLNHNGKDCVMDSVTSVFQLNYPNFELILVDNNSTDGSPEMFRRQFPKVVLIKNDSNFGFGPANNVGIAYALDHGADYILLLNNDTMVEKDFLTTMVDVMENDPKIGIASPVVYGKNSSGIWFSGGRIDWLRMRVRHLEYDLEENYFGSDFISGRAMMIRAEVIKKIGGFDEDYFLYWEDADLCVRARKAGYGLAVIAKSRARLLEKSAENEIKNYWLVLSGLLFFKKNSPSLLKPWISLYVMVQKSKNWIDRKLWHKEVAEAIHRAHADFSKETKKITG